MTDIWFILLFAVLALGAAWLVNVVVAVLSGEHPRDTGRVWLDMVLGEVGDLVPFFRRRSFRLVCVALIATCVIGILIRRIYGG